MRIVIHELVDTIPNRDEDYMASIDSLRQFPPPWRRSARQLGLFRTTMAGGAWPKVLNLWEHSWDGVKADLRRQFQDGARDKGLEDWWSENTDLRSGGEDRLLAPAEFSPGLDDLLAEGRSGRAFLHQVLEVGPGGVEGSLARYEAVRGDLDKADGFLVGAFRVLWRPSEVVVVTGHRDFGALLAATADGGPIASARGPLVRSALSTVMLPARCNPLGPERSSR